MLSSAEGWKRKNQRLRKAETAAREVGTHTQVLVSRQTKFSNVRLLYNTSEKGQYSVQGQQLRQTTCFREGKTSV